MLRSLLVALGCSLLAVSVFAQTPGKISEKEFSVAINISGKQRMLSQKMSKEMLLVALEIDADANSKNARETMKLFGDNLKLLMAGDAERGLPVPPAAVRAQLAQVEGLWTTFRGVLEGGLANRKPSPECLAQVEAQSAALLTEANKAVMLYEEACKAAGYSVSGTAVNLAGRQRMLSQKMSKEVCLVALGIDTDANRKLLESDAALFSKTLRGLVQGDAELGLQATKSQQLTRQLAKVEKLWQQFEPIVQAVRESGTTGHDALAQLAALNPDLLAEMNKAVTMMESDSQ